MSGAGEDFPASRLQITAIDSTAKKIAFVQAAAAARHLSNLNPLCVRVEDAAMLKYKQTFTVGTSRAVAKLSVLAELVLPYVKVGGALVALKGVSGRDEVADAKNAIHQLGGELEEIREKSLLFGSTSESRTIVIIRKVAETPALYPRPYAAILKKPL